MRVRVNIPIDKHYVAPQRGTKQGQTRNDERGRGTGGKGEGGEKGTMGSRGWALLRSNPATGERAVKGRGRGVGGRTVELMKKCRRRSLTLHAEAAAADCCREHAIPGHPAGAREHESERWCRPPAPPTDRLERGQESRRAAASGRRRRGDGRGKWLQPPRSGHSVRGARDSRVRGRSGRQARRCGRADAWSH